MIRRMVRDLDFPVRIEGLPTVREADGLAMSSRNAYLERARTASARPRSRGRCAPPRSRARATSRSRPASRRRAPSSAAAGIEPEYLEARDPDDLTPVAELNGRPVLVAVAARVGGARLIDNVLIQPRTKT